MRSLLMLTCALALLAACRSKPTDATADAAAAVPMLTGDITLAYAGEVDSLCAFFPLGMLYEKPLPQPSDDPVAYLRAQAPRAEQPRTRALIAAVLDAPKSERAKIVRLAFLGEAKLLLPTTRNNPSAPTAPWGIDDTPRTWGCPLADRLDAVAR
jgi:hypothetical protein